MKSPKNFTHAASLSYRYDGRGSLYDLRPFDADTCNKITNFTQEDMEVERLCDEERYLELHTDLMEKATYEGVAF